MCTAKFTSKHYLSSSSHFVLPKMVILINPSYRCIFHCFISPKKSLYRRTAALSKTYTIKIINAQFQIGPANFIDLAEIAIRWLSQKHTFYVQSVLFKSTKKCVIGLGFSFIADAQSLQCVSTKGTSVLLNHGYDWCIFF